MAALSASRAVGFRSIQSARPLQLVCPIAHRPVRSAAIRPVVLTRAQQDEINQVDTEALQADINEKLSETGNYLKEKWDQTEDKPAAVLLTFAIFLGLVAANSVVDAIERIPIVSGVIELVGLGVTGWFIYRYLLFGPDREELLSNIDEIVNKITGKPKGSL